MSHRACGRGDIATTDEEHFLKRPQVVGCRLDEDSLQDGAERFDGRRRRHRHNQPRRRNRIVSPISIRAINATTTQNENGSFSPGTGTFIP